MVTLMLRTADSCAPYSRVMIGISYSKNGIVHGAMLISDLSVYIDSEYVKYTYQEKFRIDMYRV